MYASSLSSSDSLAWSKDARSCDPLAGCTHKNCASCMIYTLAWRERLLARMAEDLDEEAFAA